MSELTLDDYKKSLSIMGTKKFREDFLIQLKARSPLFYVTTNEEKRFNTFLDNFVKVHGYSCYVWDCYKGLIDLETQKKAVSDDSIILPNAILNHIITESNRYSGNDNKVDGLKKEKKKGVIFVLCDFFRFIDPVHRKPNPDLERRLKALYDIDKIRVTTIITGPRFAIPEVLEDMVPLLDFPYPNKEELKEVVWEAVEGVEDRIVDIKTKTIKMEEKVVNSISGLTLAESETALATSLLKHKDWKIETLIEEKKQVIQRSGMLEFYDKTVGLEEVGGLKNLITWIKQRKDCFSTEAEKYGLSKPKGLMTIGFPGCGKSLVCKAISGLWGMPLLRLDFGKLFHSHIGASEENMRKALKVAESISPCVLWIDEIEKGLAGTRSSGRTDGGTTSRVLSTFLTWMQEKTSSVFVVATANDHASIPPEFLRAGRFDEIFFVDLPNWLERMEIYSVLLRKKGYDVSGFDIRALATNTELYSGAEIEKSIDKAMLTGFLDNKRMITNKDIQNALDFQPLAKMRSDDFDGLSDWAKENCVQASEQVEEEFNLGKKDMGDIDLE